MNRVFRSKWFTLLLTLAFAVLLFWNANSDTKVLKNQKIPSMTTVAEDVPIQLNFDDKKYYISGFAPTTTVDLQSNNKVLLDGEANELTRSFSVEADLTKLGIGKHEVPLKIRNLNNLVSATLKDTTISVTIEKRETRQFKVVPEINDNLLKQGYTLGSITTEPSEVSITAGDKTLDNIDKVSAVLGDVRNLTEDMTKQVDLVALDKEGNTLGVIIDPTTVQVLVNVTAPSKSVPLNVKQAGSIASGIKEFTFKPEMDNIVIYGPRETIDNVDELELLIDTTGITKKEVESYAITVPEGVELDPAVVQVEVNPVKKK